MTIGREGLRGRRIRPAFISACLDREGGRDLRCLRTEISEFRDVLNESDLRAVDVFTGEISIDPMQKQTRQMMEIFAFLFSEMNRRK